MTSLVVAKVLKAGALASLQDLGRQHSMQQGVTESGVMDVHAALWANRLLGRPATAEVIEITLGLFHLEFLEECRVAVTGADLQAKLNGESISAWQSYSLQQGDVLEFNFPSTPSNGLRAYLALDVDLDLSRYFNSVSVLELKGAALQAGDELFANNIKQLNINGRLQRKVPDEFTIDYGAQEVLQVDVVPTYQFDDFNEQARVTFTQSIYGIKNNSNRMAYCFEGRSITHEIAELASEGIAYGAIQIPPDGQPIVLLNDRQTMGGYPKIGCVTRLSGARLAQAFYPQKIQFRFVEIGDAREQWIDFLRFFMHN